MSTAGDRVVAAALADAFLAVGGPPLDALPPPEGSPQPPAAGAGWSRAALVDRGALVLGARRRWLGPLATVVLATYPAPPADRPRELAAVVALAPPFQAAAEATHRRGRPLRAVRHVLAASRATRHPWPTAPLDDLADLAELLGLTQGELAWMADTQLRQRRAPAGPLHLHRHRWLTRPGRTPRLLEVPRPRLRAVQRVLLDRVVGPVPVHSAAHGFVPGRSALTGARPHVGADVVITLDLAAFFPSVRVGRVHGVLRSAGLPEAVAHAVAGLCTSAAPVRVVAAMPSGGDPDERARLRRALAAPHLTQGAPTSPHLANLAVRGLDLRLEGLARSLGATYTRYADDLVLSGGADLRRRADAVVRAVERVVADEGHRLHPAKTRVQGRAGRQSVTGVVVNDRPGAGRREVDALRATLHNIAVHGPAGQDRRPAAARARRPGAEGLREHLTGRVAWVEQVSPPRGARLRAELEVIAW